MKGNQADGSGPLDIMARLQFGNEAYSTDITAGTTYLIVGRLSKSVPGAGNNYDSFDLWVNPTFGDMGTPDATATVGASISSFTTIGYRTANQGAGDVHLLDTLRLGTAWEDVVPPAPPSPVFVWDGGGNGTSWNDPLNWDQDLGIPDIAGETAVFDGALPGNIDLGANTFTIDSLVFTNSAGNDYTINNGTLELINILNSGTGQNTINADVVIVDSFAATTVGTFTGGDPGEGLDLEGTFVYAVEVGGTGGVSVGDATFTGSEGAGTPGMTLSAPDLRTNWFGANFGASTNDSNLNQVMTDMRFANAPTPVTVDLANLVVGEVYKLQLLFGEEFAQNHPFDVTLEGITVATGLDPFPLQGTTDGTVGGVLTYTFTASDTTLNIVLQPTTRALLNGLTLESLGPPATPGITADAGSLTLGNVSTPSTGLVGSWAFDEGAGTTTADSSSNGFTGTLVNGASWGVGQQGAAVNLDGANDYVNFGTQAAFDLVDAGTLTAWIRPTDAAGGIIMNREGEYEFAVQAGTLQWAFANTNPGWAWHDTGHAIAQNQWTHVAIVYDAAANEVRSYANGVLVDNFSPGSAIGVIGDASPTLNELWIGGRPNVVQYFQGQLDNANVFNTALSASQIANLANNLPLFSVDFAGAGDIVVNGSVAAMVNKTGAGTLSLGGSAGDVVVNDGVFTTAGAASTGGFTLDVGATLVIDGTSTGSDSINVTGAVNLSGDLTLTFPTAGLGSYILIDNDGTDAVNGAFNGVAEGTVFTLAGLQYRISYLGGDGNDVELISALYWQGDVSTLWSNGANWLGGVAPVSGDIVIFDDSTLGLTSFLSENDIAGLQLSEIIINDDVLGGDFRLIGLQTVTAAITHSQTAALANTLINVSQFVPVGATITSNAGQLDIASPTVLILDLTVDGAGDVHLQSDVAQFLSVPSITKLGTGTLTLSGNNIYGGTTNVLEGTLVADSDTGLGTTAAGTFVADGATLAFTGGLTVGLEDLDIHGAGVGGNGALQILAGGTTLDGDITLADSASVVSTGDNFLTGAVTLTQNASIASTAGTLTLTGLIGLGPNTLTFDGAGDQVVQQNISGPGGGSIVKDGAGAVSLQGVNSNYTGTTTVNDGTLLVNGGISSAVDVFGGTLGGTGFTGAVHVFSGGSIAPGVGGAGTLTTSNFALDLGATFNIAPGTSRLNVFGAVNLGGDLTSSGGGGFGNITIIDNNGSADPVVGTFNGLAEGAQVNLGGVVYNITYVGGDGNDVVLIRNLFAAVDDSYTTLLDTPLTVAGPGVLANDVSNLNPVTPGVTLEWNAQDDADLLWEPSVQNTGAAGELDWDFATAGGVTHTAVDSVFAGIGAAYSFDGLGGGNLETVTSFNPAIDDSLPATFEIWVRPTDLVGKEVLFETGGSGNGLAILLNDDVVEFATSNGTTNLEIATFNLMTAGIGAGEFIQIVGVIDTGAAQTLTLYVNGATQASSIVDMSADGTDNVNWSGTGEAGLGRGDGSTATNALAGALAGYGSFDGEIALLRFYENAALTGAQVADNFFATAMGDLKVDSFDAVSANGGTVEGLLMEIGETGTVTGLTHVAQTVNLLRDYVNPVVILGPLNSVGTNPSVVRVTNVNAATDTFSLVVVEAPDQDGTHGAETVSYIVLEAGVYQLANGSILEVGTVNTGATVNVNGSMTPVALNGGFSSSPILMTEIQGGTDYVTTRTIAANNEGFEVALETVEGSATPHAVATVGYLAIEPGQGTWSGTTTFEAGLAPTPVTNADTTINFQTTYAATPMFFGKIADYSDPDSAKLRYRTLGTSSADVFIEESTDADAELVHNPEIVNYMAISAAGLLSANDPASFVYTPPAGFVGTDTFTYDAVDALGNIYTATVTIDVTNTPPTVSDPVAISADEDGAVVTTPVMVFDAEEGPATLTYNFTQPSEGTVTNNLDGTFDFDPNPGVDFQDLALGETRDVTFTVQVTDSAGVVSNVGTVTVTVTGVNDAPTVIDAALAADEDGGIVTTGVIADDVDSDDNPGSLAYTITQPSEGTAIDNGDGTFSFDPGTEFQDLALGEQRVVTFTVFATDQHTASSTPIATVTVTVTGVNDDPAMVDDALTTTEDGPAVTTGVLSADVDSDDDPSTLTYNITPPGAGGLVTDNGDGTFTFDPNGAYDNLALGDTQIVTFTVTATDQHGGVSNVSTVTVTITGENDAPTVLDGVLAVGEDGPSATTIVLADDVDNDNNPNDLTYTIVPPGQGLVTDNGNGAFTFDPNGDFENLALGSTQIVTFTVQATDRHGALSNVGTVTVTVSGRNDNPTITGANLNADEDGPVVTTGVLSADGDDDDDPTTLTYTITQPIEGTAIDNGDGTFSFDPGTDFQDLFLGETRVVTFTVRATDSHGGNSTTETITVTVTGVNDNPTMTDGTIAVNAGGPAGTTLLLSADVDNDDNPNTLIYNVTGPGAGMGLVTDNGNGTFTFDPNGDFNALAGGATQNVIFTVTATDSHGAVSNVGTVTVTVTGDNEAPTVIDSTLTTDEDTPATTIVLSNDNDVDDDPTTLTYTIGQPSEGIVIDNGDGTFTFDPNGDFEDLGLGQFRNVSFTVQATDRHGAVSNLGTVDVTVNGVNDPPTVNPATFTIVENSPNGTPVGTATATDPESQPFTFAIVGGTGQTAFAIDPNTGAITVIDSSQLDFDTTPTLTLIVEATDSQGATATGTITINLTDILDTPGPIAVDDLYVSSNRTIVVPASGVLFNDIDADTPRANLTVTGLGTSTSAAGLIAVGKNRGNSLVRVFDPGTGLEVYSFFAYGAGLESGVRVAVGDVDADGVADIITVPGKGGAPHVKVFSGATGEVIMSFFAYNSLVTAGVFVASGDVNGDGYADIITSPDRGVGPNVKVFSGQTGELIKSFFAYVPQFTGGVRVASADVNGDGFADIITGAGAGGGPHVQVFSGSNFASIHSFFAYAPNFTGGLYIASGDVDGDGRADIITGAGPGGGPHVQVFSGLTGQSIRSFFAYDVSFTGGVRVGAADMNGDDIADILTGAGPGGGPHVRVFDGRDGNFFHSFFAYPETFTRGVFISGGVGGSVSGPSHGTVVLNSDGSFTYTADPGFYGFDRFAYVVSDGSQSDVGVVTIQIPAGGAPIAPSPRIYEGNVGSQLNVSASLGLLSGVRDPDGNPLTIEVTKQPPIGSLNVQANGAFSFLPPATFIGTTSFTYRVLDSKGQFTDVIVLLVFDDGRQSDR